MPTITSVLSDYMTLSAADQEKVKSVILSHFRTGMDMETFVKEERFKNGNVCSVCGGTHIVRNGKMNGKQRYVCRECGKSFFVTSNSIAGGTRKDLATWEKYIDCMMNGFSIRKTADICRIHKNTAFAWRHKILDALQQMADSVTLGGIVETDERFLDFRTRGTIRTARHSKCLAWHTTAGHEANFVASQKRRCVSLVR